MSKQTRRDDFWIRKEKELDDGDGIPVDELRIVLLGKTGTGKSATGNTLIGQKVFVSRFAAKAVTEVCQRHVVTAYDKTIMVVDTPGLFDTTVSAEKTKNEIVKCTGITAPGPHAFLIVLSFTTQAEEEQQVASEIADLFGFGMFRYGIVLFTGKDQLSKQNKTPDEYLKKVPTKIRQMLDNCQNRCIAIDNGSSDKESERKSLLDMIMKMVKENGGTYFTNTSIDKAENIMKQSIKNIYTREREIIQEKHKTYGKQEESTANNQPAEVIIKDYLRLTDQEKMAFKGRLEKIITPQNIRKHLRDDCEKEGETHSDITKHINCSIS